MSDEVTTALDRTAVDYTPWTFHESAGPEQKARQRLVPRGSRRVSGELGYRPRGVHRPEPGTDGRPGWAPRGSNPEPAD